MSKWKKQHIQNFLMLGCSFQFASRFLFSLSLSPSRSSCSQCTPVQVWDFFQTLESNKKQAHLVYQNIFKSASVTSSFPIISVLVWWQHHSSAQQELEEVWVCTTMVHLFWKSSCNSLLFRTLLKISVLAWVQKVSVATWYSLLQVFFLL